MPRTRIASLVPRHGQGREHKMPLLPSHAAGWDPFTAFESARRDRDVQPRPRRHNGLGQEKQPAPQRACSRITVKHALPHVPQAGLLQDFWTRCCNCQPGQDLTVLRKSVHVLEHTVAGDSHFNASKVQLQSMANFPLDFKWSRIGPSICNRLIFLAAKQGT